MFEYIREIVGIHDQSAQDFDSLVNSGWFQIRSTGGLTVFRGMSYNNMLTNLEALPIKDCCVGMLCDTSVSDEAVCNQCKSYVEPGDPISLMVNDSKLPTYTWRAMDEVIDGLAPSYSLGVFENVLCAGEIFNFVQEYGKFNVPLRFEISKVSKNRNPAPINPLPATTTGIHPIHFNSWQRPLRPLRESLYASLNAIKDKPRRLSR